MQYLFLRLAVPVFGTAAAAEARALFAALFLVPWVLYVARQRIGRPSTGRTTLRSRW